MHKLRLAVGDVAETLWQLIFAQVLRTMNNKKNGDIKDFINHLKKKVQEYVQYNNGPHQAGYERIYS